jgi:UDP-glucose 4-epimerase
MCAEGDWSLMGKYSSALIVGGAGFIGSHIAEFLSGRKFEVIVVDNLLRGKVENISPLLDRGVRFVNADVRDYDLIKSYFEGVDVVFDLAGTVGVKFATRRPLEVLDNNIDSLRNVLKASVDGEVRKVIYVSSSEVYGNIEVVPMAEDLPLSPVSPYGISKIVGEAYCKAFGRKYGLNTSMVRYFNVYGPRQSPDDKSWVVPTFITNAIEGRPLILHGSGSQTRDFTFISDAVEGIMLVAEKDEGSGESYNIGSGKETSIRELAELVLAIGGGKGSIGYTRLRSFHIRRRCGDISKARERLGYEPKVSLKEGLKITWDYFVRRMEEAGKCRGKKPGVRERDVA